MTFFSFSRPKISSYGRPETKKKAFRFRVRAILTKRMHSFRGPDWTTKKIDEEVKQGTIPFWRLSWSTWWSHHHCYCVWSQTLFSFLLLLHEFGRICAMNVIDDEIPSSERAFSPNPDKPTEDKVSALSPTIFEWCEQIEQQNITNSNCGCDLCCLMRLQKYVPFRIMFKGTLHNLCDSDHDVFPTGKCSKCVTCFDFRHALHRWEFCCPEGETNCDICFEDHHLPRLMILQGLDDPFPG